MADKALVQAPAALTDDSCPAVHRPEPQDLILGQ
jgi:hypothetical protein